MITKNVWLNPDFANGSSEHAIFADRDGTLIRHVDYISDPKDVELLPGVKESVQHLIQQQIPFFIITNQSGVGRGYFPIEQVYACQKRFFELLEIEPIQIAGWCIAPEAPEMDGGYRKPSPRFIQEACSQLNIQPTQCHMIGDTLVDLETAWSSGAKAWAVSCGKSQLPQRILADEISGDCTLKKDFPTCVEAILTA